MTGRRECIMRCVGDTGPGDVWVAGDGDRVLRWSGAAWSILQGPTATYGRWTTCGTGPGGPFWLLGDDGSLSRWSGTAWINERVLGRDESPFEPGPYFRGSISGLWTDAAGTSWVVGTGTEAASTLARWDGRACGPLRSPTPTITYARCGARAPRRRGPSPTAGSSSAGVHDEGRSCGA